MVRHRNATGTIRGGSELRSPGNGSSVPPTPETVALLADGAMEIVMSRLNSDAESVGELHGCLSDEERQRASRFAFDLDRRRFIVARARLRQLLAARLDLQPGSVELRYGARGKPALARRGTAPDLRFNVSHADDIAVYAFSIGREIGIDIEAVREMKCADEITAKCFSKREREMYFSLDPRDRAEGFFNCWTRKEAFIKALGDGFYHALDRFDVSLTPGEPARILRMDDTPGDDCGWRLDSFCPAPGYVAAVVTERRQRRGEFVVSAPRLATLATAP